MEAKVIYEILKKGDLVSYRDAPPRAFRPGIIFPDTNDVGIVVETNGDNSVGVRWQKSGLLYSYSREELNILARSAGSLERGGTRIA